MSLASATQAFGEVGTKSLMNAVVVPAFRPQATIAHPVKALPNILRHPVRQMRSSDRLLQMAQRTLGPHH